MKRLVLGLVSLCFIGIALAEDAPQATYRDFTSSDGRSIKGRIIKYDAGRKKIYFEREDRKQMWISSAAFSKEDQFYIRDWIVAEQFLSETQLKVSIQEHEEKLGEDAKDDAMDLRHSSEDVRFRHIYYTLTLDNRTGARIEDVTFDFCCHVERKGGHENSDSDVWVLGQVVIGSLEAGKNSCRTPPLQLETVFDTIEEYGSGRKVSKYQVKIWEDDVSGALFRIHGPQLDGVQIFRSVCFPAAFSRNNTWPVSKVSTFLLNPFKETLVSAGGLDARYARKTARKMSELEELVVNTGSREERDKVLKELRDLYDPQQDESGYSAFEIAGCHNRCGENEIAIQWYEKSLKKGCTNAHAALSEIYSSGSPEVLNAAKALMHAKAAIASSPRKRPKLLDLLARAYARDGRFKWAVVTQKQAINELPRSSKSTPEKEEYKKRLVLYEAGKPYAGTIKL